MSVVERFWLSPLLSGLWTPPAKPPGHDWGPLITLGNGSGFSLYSLNFWLQFLDLHLHPLHTLLHSFHCPLAQTLEVGEEISGTHGYSILIKQSNEAVLASINKTQKSFRLLVPGKVVTHHCSPSCHHQFGHPHQRGGTGCWIPGTMGCGFPMKWGYTQSQALGRLIPPAWGIGNQTYNQGPGIPLKLMLMGLEKKRVKVNSQVCLMLGPAPYVTVPFL